MKSMLKKIKFVLLFFCTINFYGQQVNVIGTVVDGAQSPISGVNIMVKGVLSMGSITDSKGNFSLPVEKNQTLVFSYIGFENKEIVYRGQSLENIVMVENAQALDELVVIGYQSVKKVDLTGAVSIYNTKTMKNAIVTGSVGDALISVPGVTVRSSGSPGSEGKVEIRGTSTFGNSNPLYVVDGVISSAGRDFNFNDVESIQVLKDASAAAIYGSRAANGVIIVTTKRGKLGKMKVDFSYKTTFQTLPTFDLANREQWVKLNDLAFTNAGRVPAKHNSGDTDWQKKTFKTGIVGDYNLAFSGAEPSSSYYISGNYQTNSGTTFGTKSDRLTLRSNTSAERKFGENFVLRIGENISLSNYKLDIMSLNPIIDVIRMLPTMDVYNDKNPGGYNYGSNSNDITFGTNPIARENLEDATTENLRIQGNVFTELQFNKALKYRFNIGFNQSNEMYKYLRKAGTWRMNEPIAPTSLNKNQSRYNSMIYDNTLNYNKKFGDHDIAVVGGISYQDTKYEQIWGSKNDVLMNGSSYFYQLDAATSNPKTGGFQDIEKMFSMFGRLNYGYLDKYLFSFTIRRDQSSKFSPELNTGIFPSVSGAWKISKENFFKVDWINDLKVRANYGILGSSNIGVWDWTSFMNTFPQAVFGTDQHVENGVTQVKLANSDLTWEELHALDAGFDLSILNNKIQVTFDYFVKDTRDVLTPLPILMAVGNNGGNPLVNAASVKNSGVDLMVTWKDNVGDFNYNISLNGSYLKNKITELGYGRTQFDSSLTRSKVGESIGDWYLIKTNGLFRSDAEVQAYKNSAGQLIQSNAKPGDVKYVDFNDDGKISDADRQYCGSSIPKFQLGANLGFDYKGLDFMMLFTSALGNKIYNGPRNWYEGMDDGTNYRANYDAWTPENPNAKDPRPIFGDTRNVIDNQDRWLENGNYLRLSQVAIGYSLPKSILGNNSLQARVFLNLQNVFTITSYTGLDPEFLNTNIFERSNDTGAFPNPRGFTVGAQVSF